MNMKTIKGLIVDVKMNQAEWYFMVGVCTILPRCSLDWVMVFPCSWISILHHRFIQNALCVSRHILLLQVSYFAVHQRAECQGTQNSTANGLANFIIAIKRFFKTHSTHFMQEKMPFHFCYLPLQNAFLRVFFQLQWPKLFMAQDSKIYEKCIRIVMLVTWFPRNFFVNA